MVTDIIGVLLDTIFSLLYGFLKIACEHLNCQEIIIKIVLGAVGLSGIASIVIFVTKRINK
jgi:hypothetical protein